MRKTNKKGFTIVELVVVVAVIAILAAVLIPTFSGIIKKANEASDTVVAKEINTALAQYSAENGDPEDFNEAILAIQAAGYDLANLNAKAGGNLYAWDSANNQIVYINAKGETLYKNVDYDQANLKFIVANDAAIVPDWAADDAVINMAMPSDANFLKNAFATGGAVALGGDIKVTDESVTSINVITQDTTIDFGNYILNLDIPNATRNTDNWVALMIKGGDVILDGGANGGVVTADNGELYAVALYNEYSEGSNVTIKGGKYIGGGHAVYIKMPNSTVTIEGGYFEATGEGPTDYAINVNNNFKGQSKFILKGGTFVNFNPAEVPSGEENEVFVADGYKVASKTVGDDTWYTVYTGSVPTGYTEWTAPAAG